MSKTLVVLICILLAVPSVTAQTVMKPEELRLRVNKVLLKRDLNELVVELAGSKGGTVDKLLFSLDVFERAGRRELVRETVRRFSAAPDLPPSAQRNWLLDIVRQKIFDDVEALRLYYEVLAVDDGYYHTNPFIDAWSRTSDARAIDAFIEKRAENLNSWSVIRLERSVKNGTVRKVLDEFAARLRADPNELTALNNYLGALSHVQQYTSKDEPVKFAHEADWLYELFPTTTAKDAYDRGARFEDAAPRLAIKYFTDSLSRPVSEADVRSLAQANAIMSNYPSKKVNWEKQLRYWTKQKLAAAYKRTGQAMLAQPLVEEVVAAAKDADIYTQDNFQLAGSVQSQSGMRVVEAKVLQDAAAASKSPEYWRERINYYVGRNEIDGVVNSFRDALAAIDNQSKDRFIYSFHWSARHAVLTSSDSERHRSELSRILTAEFNKASRGNDLAFRIVSTAASRGFGLSDFMETHFVARQDLFSTVFQDRPEWNGEEKEVLVEILRDTRLTPDTKKFYIAELERIAVKSPIERRWQLAEIFKDAREHARSIPHLIYYIDNAPLGPESSGRSFAVTSLFEAYVNAGNWQMAEKLMNDRQADFLAYLGNFLERLAISAGQQNAPDDAFRIWMKAVNFSGHSRFGLINLADTTTKPLLRRYYEQMKQKDPSSEAAERALAILR